ncbi:sigma-54-dependent transcriptional regulator [Desulfospira joergensenii]|uniref:sigma-54-dependent transcriptional regulator n=1 Tax=Desulfospira joergensenii TaxID=53329 RepID=UPI0003B60558|nr:sigma-54 dependent transcriptional regulator [Desulfospira joergensenii]
MKERILVIDDEQDMLTLIDRIISEDTDYEAVIEKDPKKALERFKSRSFDLVMTDLKMPGLSGIQVLEQVKALRPEVAVVILTAYATIETAVEATRKGADDYLTKPFRRDRLLVTLERAMKLQKMVRENKKLRLALEKMPNMSMTGSSPSMKKVFEKIRQAAPSSGTVLITGASGTGKELVARALHRYSRRRDKRLVIVNCTAIPENMIESELFGHVKGAFTGAVSDKKGLVQEADGGTLFLDEIGDLSPALQTRLLRLLQEGEYRPVGSVKTCRADLRFIAATNRDLEEAIQEKTFREDLFYRLNVIRLRLPSLEERREDIPLLSQYFLCKYAAINGKEIKGITSAALAALVKMKFPGNVRELENTIERGVIFCSTDTLTLSDLGLSVPEQGLPGPVRDPDRPFMNFKEAKEENIRLFHAQYIRALLKKNEGNISKAADMAGIQRQYLHRLMKESRIASDDFRGKKDPVSL